MMNKKGFVLMETLVVISVLCTVLVVLYASYGSILSKVQTESLYDNTEYIFKTNIVREYLESTLNESVYNNSTQYYIVCQNSNPTNMCYSEEIYNNYQNDLFKFLKVEAIYITIWDTNQIRPSDISGFEVTTQNYIKNLDPTEISAHRIVVMYKQENNDTTKPIYEYASLRFGNRG